MQWDWVQWLIPLVALAVWILSNLARVREEEQPRRARPPQARSDAESAEAQPRKNSDVDQYLEEARRRREQREARKKAEAEARRSTPVREEPRRAPPPVPPARVDPVRKPAPPPLPKVVVKSAPAARSSNPNLEEVVVAKIVTPPSPPPADVLPQVIETKTLQQPSRPKVFELLRSRDKLQAAFVLREVFDAPLCKRRSGKERQP